MKWLLIAICISPFVVISLMDEMPQNTRKQMELRHRFLSNADSTTIQQKNAYFRRAVLKVTDNRPDDLRHLNWGKIALEMNRMEQEYELPYYWGGSIRNHLKGLDCSGFIHGLLYYTGESDYRRRFNTKNFYHKLRKDHGYVQVYNALEHSSIKKQCDQVCYLNAPFDATQPPDELDSLVRQLKIGDIILWPSGIRDGRNIPGAIWGHVGIVSTFKNGRPMVTHYVSSEAYNHLDIFERKGPGINTLDAKTFISLKQRGVLTVFRRKGRSRGEPFDLWKVHSSGWNDNVKSSLKN